MNTCSSPVGVRVPLASVQRSIRSLTAGRQEGPHGSLQYQVLLSLRTNKSTMGWKLFSRETAVSCSMCKKLCPLACKANTQHSQQQGGGGGPVMLYPSDKDTL
ncbi:hypothetical protein EYF80_051814 [Liparis tanakae]|uniref:Uncharacterized protein n=1 Tax=Liparis tanakae TaxID=230148 RepID=A0A4Z2FA09_9TELE|nr:hypothetical protein EYF80_051814 [Liparis tanakae]